MSTAHDHIPFIDETRHWLERVVIGINLCPFAATPWRANRIHFSVSRATEPEQLVRDLAREMVALQDADPAERETTLLIHPDVLGDFLDYNDFLEIADALLEDLELDGILQVASFHPDYRFADAPPDDPAHCTNRSPYPTLHLLREASIEAATKSIRNPDAIYERNIETLRRLGIAGWKRLMP
jgi:hypothetical protein